MDFSPVSLSQGIELLPKPPGPGLYAALGDRDLIHRSLRALTVAFTPQHRILWVDAANQFNAHWIAQSARAHRLNSREALRAFHYARPFTAFQLESMVNLKLLAAFRKHESLFAVIADPLSLYEHAEAQAYSISRSFALFQKGLKDLTQEIAILLLIPSPENTLNFQRLLQISTRVLDLRQNTQATTPCRR